MNEPKPLPIFETPEQVSAYCHNRLMTILSRLAFDHYDDAKKLTAQLVSDMASVGQRAKMQAEVSDPERYDLSALPERSAFDE